MLLSLKMFLNLNQMVCCRCNIPLVMRKSEMLQSTRLVLKQGRESAFVTHNGKQALCTVAILMWMCVNICVQYNFCGTYSGGCNTIAVSRSTMWDFPAGEVFVLQLLPLLIKAVPILTFFCHLIDSGLRKRPWTWRLPTPQCVRCEFRPSPFSPRGSLELPALCFARICYL